MTVLTLQEFLRSLGGSLATVGVPPKSLDDLRAVSHALEPFKDFDLAQLTDFLKRAAEFRRTGEVPAVTVPGLDHAMMTARKLSQSVQSLGASDTGEVESHLNAGKRDLQTALGTVAGAFGLAAKFTDDKKWFANLRAKAATTQAVEAFRRLAPQITEPASYQSEAVTAAIDQLAATDAKVLKASAAELGASGTGAGKKFVESVLVKLTGISNKPPKAGKKAKEEPTATEEQLEAMAKTLEGMVVRAKDPNAVPDSEIDAILARVNREFSTDQQKAIAKRVTGTGGRSAKDAVDRLRADLTAVKRLLESQKV